MSNMGNTSYINVSHKVMVPVKLRGSLTHHSQVQVCNCPGTTLVQPRRTESSVSSATKQSTLKENVGRTTNQKKDQDHLGQPATTEATATTSISFNRAGFSSILDSSSEEKIVH